MVADTADVGDRSLKLKMFGMYGPSSRSAFMNLNPRTIASVIEQKMNRHTVTSKYSSVDTQPSHGN